MDATDLVVHGPLAWLRLLATAALYLAPGAVIALCWLPARPYRMFMAPVFSISVVGGSAILLGAFGMPLSTGTTLALAVLWTAGLALAAWRVWPRRWAERRPIKTAWREHLTLAGVLLLVALAQSSPHLDEVDPSAATAWPHLAIQGAQAMAGGGSPYPVHMDEYMHMARTAEIVRSGDPFADRDRSLGLDEAALKGANGLLFHVGLAQADAAAGVSLPFLWRFLPAAWAAVMAGVVFTTLRGTPGALVSAAMIAALPTTLLILGPGFLVPVTFGLAWTVAAWNIAAHGRTRWDLALLALIVASAALVHPVAGALTFLVAVLTLVACRPDRATRMVAVAALAALPLLALWVPPETFDAMFEANRTPWGQETLVAMGWLIPALALFGAVAAFLRNTKLGSEHRAMVGVGALVAATIGLMALLDIKSLALFHRTQHTLFLAEAILAGAGIGAAGVWLRDRIPTIRPAAVAAGAAVFFVIAAAPAMAHHLSMDRYHVFDEPSWEAAQVAVDAGVGPEDRFLSEPWRAIFYKAMTGARPHAWFLPAGPAVNADDYDTYQESGGASEDGLRSEGITWIIDPVAPNAANITHSPWVYELTWAPE